MSSQVIAEKFSIDEEHDVIAVPVGDSIVNVPIELSGKTRGGDPRWVVPEYWRQKQKHLAEWTNRPNFVIEVQDDPIVDYLKGGTMDSPFSFEIAPKSNPKKRFMDVLLAFNDIHNNTGVMSGTEPFDIMKDKNLGGRKVKLKFLNLAKSIGLYEERFDRPKVTRKASVIEKDLEDFQEKHPSVKEWLENTEFASDLSNIGQVSGNLKKATMIMDISPYELMNLRYEKGHAKEGQLIDDAKDYEAWLKNRWKTKTWTAQDGTKWSLDEWMRSNDPNRPYISGKGNKFSKEGDRVAQQKRRQSKSESESQYKQILIATKHYFVYHNKVRGGKRGKGSIFVMPKTELKYNTLSMTAEQILKSMNTLAELKTPEQLTFEEDSIYGLLEEIDDTDIIEDQLDNKIAGKVARKTYETTQADWNDAYLYFMVALDVGWRASEGFTATYGTPAYWQTTDWKEKYQTGVWIRKIKGLAEGIMEIKFLTRKTWGMHDKKGKERTTHTEMILTPKTKELVEAKTKLIAEGISQYGKMKPQEIFEKYGVMQYKTVDGKQQLNFDHALIGTDDKYVKVETMKFPTKHKLTKKAVREMREKGETPRKLTVQTEAQEKLHAIMRQAFIASGVDLEEVVEGEVIGRYWLTDSLHSLRHVFAQKWLLQSNWNFTFVSKKGHWGAPQILQDAYGGQSNEQYISDSLQFAKKSLEDAEKEAQEQLNFGEVEKDLGDTIDSKDKGEAGKV